MSSQIFVDFKPAELHDMGSGTLIVFSVLDPSTGVLELADDVAHVKWGGEWRIPTTDEWKEL